MPVIIIPRLLLSLLSWAILAAAIYLLWSWGRGYDVVDVHRVVHHVRGPAWRLYLGGVLLAWSFLGRFVVLMFIPGGKDEPREERADGHVVPAPDGSALRVESFGKAQAPTLVLTHGWGLNSTAWWYTKKARGDLNRSLALRLLPGSRDQGQDARGDRSALAGRQETEGLGTFGEIGPRYKPCTGGLP